MEDYLKNIVGRVLPKKLFEAVGGWATKTGGWVSKN